MRAAVSITRLDLTASELREAASGELDSCRLLRQRASGAKPESERSKSEESAHHQGSIGLMREVSLLSHVEQLRHPEGLAKRDSREAWRRLVTPWFRMDTLMPPPPNRLGGGSSR